MSILDFGSDIGFYAPVVAMAELWSGRAYVYHFNEPNPWEGPWKGHATHILDVAYLFLNYMEFLLPAQQCIATVFAEDFITFVNGKAPWPAWRAGKGGTKVYGPTSEGSVDREALYVDNQNLQKTGRREVIWKLGEVVGLDSLSMAFVNFLHGG